MDFKTAEKLKEARFPQSLSPTAHYFVNPKMVIQRDKALDYITWSDSKPIAMNALVYCPTLEDLVTFLDGPEVLQELRDEYIRKVFTKLGAK